MTVPKPRGHNPHLPQDPAKVGLPPRPFLYTLDQLSVILNVDEPQLRTQYIYYEGRSTGVRSVRFLLARDINPDPTKNPDWRVAERELIRWMKVMGFKYYDRGAITH